MSEKFLMVDDAEQGLALRRKGADEVPEIADKADKNAAIANADQLIAKTGTVDREPYLMRPTGGTAKVYDREIDKLIGGTVCWNQICEKSAFTWTSEPRSATRVYDEASDTTTLTGTSASDKTYAYCQRGTSGAVRQRHVYLMSAIAETETAAITAIWLKPDGLTGTPPSHAYTGKKRYSSIQKVGVGTNYGNNSLLGVTLPAGTPFSVSFSKVQLHDLTQMFGNASAVVVYTRETARQGAGVAWVRRWFPEDYYEYDPGSLQSVRALSHITTGFNQWDEEWEIGAFDAQTGEKADETGRIRSKNFIPVIPGTAYWFKHANSARVLFYGWDKEYLNAGEWSAEGSLSVPWGCRYIMFELESAYGAAYKEDVCVNISGPNDGKYAPYEAPREYPLDTDLELRGIWKLGPDNHPYCDGDEYESGGRVKRRFGIVDLGTLSWSYHTTQSEANPNQFRAAVNNMRQYAASALPNAVSERYVAMSQSDLLGSTAYDRAFSIFWSSKKGVNIIDREYTDAAAFKAAVSGVYMVYELADEYKSDEEADAFQGLQIVDAGGTEEYTDAAVEAGTRDIAVPAGHDTFYPEGIRQKVEGLPSDFSTLIADTEVGMTATRNYTAGEFIIVENQLYKVTANIANGGAIVAGTNVAATTIGEQLTAILAALNA